MGQHFSGGNIPPPGYRVNDADVCLFRYGNNHYQCRRFVRHFYFQLSNDSNSMNRIGKT